MFVNLSNCVKEEVQEKEEAIIRWGLCCSGTAEL